MDEQSFIERYESPAIPVVITDSQLEWQASKKWTIEVRSCVTVQGEDPASGSHSDALCGKLSMFSKHAKICII